MSMAVLFEALDCSSRVIEKSMVVKLVQQVFVERIAHKVFNVILMHITIKPLCLHDVMCQVYDDLSVWKVFEEMPTHQTYLKIMIKSLLGKL